MPSQADGLVWLRLNVEADVHRQPLTERALRTARKQGSGQKQEASVRPSVAHTRADEG